MDDGINNEGDITLAADLGNGKKFTVSRKFRDLSGLVSKTLDDMVEEKDIPLELKERELT
jgi:hypothetical protein